jgi:hypothetical protein
MPSYRVIVRPDPRLTYYVEAASAKEAERKAGELWSKDVEPDEIDHNGPDIHAEEIKD